MEYVTVITEELIKSIEENQLALISGVYEGEEEWAQSMDIII